MFIPIANTPRSYSWGSAGAITDLLGVATGGVVDRKAHSVEGVAAELEAELWLGAHPGSPSRILTPGAVGGAENLADWIASNPDDALGGRPLLPFLLKVLAADSPLSLQAHPTSEQALAGFERENALGIPLDAPHRNYRDAHPKPEIIVTVSQKFEALCGFRPVAQTREVFEAFGLGELVPRLASLSGLFEWLMTRGDGVDDALARALAFTKTTEIGSEHGISETKAVAAVANSVVLDAVDTVRTLSASYPGDPGILAALLLNKVTLRPGEALYLPAGNIHAYLSGVGIELMTASDNVLRGGLTPKHVDVPELMHVLDFTTGTVPFLEPTVRSTSLRVYRPDDADFVLAEVSGEADWQLTGPAIALCTSGRFSLGGATASIAIGRGSAVFVTPSEDRLTFAGQGTVYLATTG